MKRKRLSLFAAAGLLLAGAFFFTPSATLKLGAEPAAPAQERREGFDDMHRAEEALRNARAILAAAPGEYGGHRDKAIKKVDEALGEVHQAIEHH
jgi:hypothetical protein